MTTVAGSSESQDRRRRRRRGSAAAVSLLAHGVIFAAVGLNAPKLIVRTPPPVTVTDVWLMSKTAVEKTTASAPFIASPRAKLPATKIRQRIKPEQHPSPVAASTRTAAVPAAPPAAGVPGRAPGFPSAPVGVDPDQGGGVREALRTSVGCDPNYERSVRPNQSETARCHQTFGIEARGAPSFMGIDTAKRGRYDAQAEADDRRRAERQGAMRQLIVPCGDTADPHSTGGSNLGAGCLSDSAIMHFQQH